MIEADMTPSSQPGKTNIEPPRLTPGVFLERNRPAIDQLFPTLLDKKNPIDPNIAVGAVTEQVWDSIKGDPIVERLGRDGFDRLPEEQRLTVLQNALALLKANDDVRTYLEQTKPK